MSRHLSSAILIACAAGLAACSGADETETAETPLDAASPPAQQEEAVDGTDTAPTPDASTESGEVAETGSLSWAVAGEWRGDNRLRDDWRNPAETLTFFEVDPSGTVIEIWPGTGWYSEILAPWIAANGGQFIAATFPADSESESRRAGRERFQAHFASDPVFGDVQLADFSAEPGAIVEPGTADTILSFRNIHNWMSAGFAERAFADFYEALRPGGTLGIVEHRLPDTREQDPRGGTGYVQQAYVIALAREAGFELVASSEINANPADTADHPYGVWTLPPTRRSAPADSPEAAEFDRAAYDAIGESDRMTLLFRKPEGQAEDTPETE